MSSLDNRFICFRLEKEHYASPLLEVKEVLGVPEITPVPQAPSYFLGIINLRGQVISVIDLRMKFGLKPNKTTETCVIIFEYPGFCVGAVVDEVESVFSVKDGELKPPPLNYDGKKKEYLVGVINRGEKLVLALDISRALDLKDTVLTKNLAQKAA
ncbi:MAG: hypothetical protein A2Z20_10285 [Bdellovibrionales bacterium RBG_16_40_8]|nr:MAG: hypothetical protein A2Z20_10285 [Bdellovibrionales bacterium RBG_16_40_8]